MKKIKPPKWLGQPPWLFLLIIAFSKGWINLGFAQAENKIKIVTTSTDLKAMAEAVGGEKVEVFSLAEGKQDLHFIEPKPSYIIKLREAQLFIRLGKGLDEWCDLLLKKAHNPNIDLGSEGYLDASGGVKIVEVPLPHTPSPDKKKELHIYGNPHYWLDPTNGQVMIENICAALLKIAPQEADFFKKNKDEFIEKLEKQITKWKKKLKPYQGTKVITYHKSWTYFLNFFGFQEVGVIEPKPGISPSPKHLTDLIKLMKSKEAQLILIEPFYSTKAAEMLAKETAAKVLILPSSVDITWKINTYIELFNYIIDKLDEVLSKNK